VLAAVLLLAGASGLATADGGPLADAGLDQEVGVNTTVQLDGTGSSHPNGSIDRYRWRIETPGGRQITPDCGDCARTGFRPQETGRYEVTLRVTDSEGRSDSDTLYVDVEEAGPSVELSGPTDPRVNESVSYETTASTSNTTLESLTWTLGPTTIERDSVSGTRTRRNHSLTFQSDERYRLVVTVTDDQNRSARDTLMIQPREQPDRSDDSDTSRTRATTTDSEAPDTEREPSCNNAGVAANPNGGGTAAAVFCTDTGQDPLTYGYDESCPASLDDCERATPNGGGDDTGQSDGATDTHGTGGREETGSKSGPDNRKISAGGGGNGFVK